MYYFYPKKPLDPEGLRGFFLILRIYLLYDIAIFSVYFLPEWMHVLEYEDTCVHAISLSG